jgi:peptide/nickel transport system permease protein
VISGSTIVAVVLSLPTTGPMMLRALQSQDMYLAGSFLMFLALLTVVGVFLSDLALVALDPRIRLEGGVTR